MDPLGHSRRLSVCLCQSVLLRQVRPLGRRRCIEELRSCALGSPDGVGTSAARLRSGPALACQPLALVRPSRRAVVAPHLQTQRAHYLAFRASLSSALRVCHPCHPSRLARSPGLPLPIRPSPPGKVSPHHHPLLPPFPASFFLLCTFFSCCAATEGEASSLRAHRLGLDTRRTAVRAGLPFRAGTRAAERRGTGQRARALNP